jgi:phosphohistidine phosphatase
MRRLILFRHGKADVAGLSGGDRERPLTPRGEAESARTAVWLNFAGYRPDLVLISPSLRTRMTWDAAIPEFPGAKVEFSDDLYLASAETILEVVHAAAPEADTVMVVGHNPGMHELAVELAESGEAPRSQLRHLDDGFPTAAAAVFHMGVEDGSVLEAIYEPPRAEGDAPRWLFSRPHEGGANGDRAKGDRD